VESRGTEPVGVHGPPIVAFYSVQGGVGTTTIARKFAELITVAPGAAGRHPNVLLVDLDIDSQGLTYRLHPRSLLGLATVHQMIAQRDVAGVQAVNVTSAVSLTSGNPTNRGQLYLVPAAPPDARSLYKDLGDIPAEELLGLLRNMIDSLVMIYQIACVVIDCAPGVSPHTAAAATLAEFPLFIGRNEEATFAQIWPLPNKFREWYGQFQPARQRVIINAVSVQNILRARAERFSVFDYIPLVSDVIHETEGLPRGDTLRMLLFEKYIVDIIREVFVGTGHHDLIPEAPEVLGPEWMEMLTNLERCEEAPRMRRLRRLRHLRWIGIALVVLGAVLAGMRQLFGGFPAGLTTAGISIVIAGAALTAAGWYAESRRQRTLADARQMIIEGPEGVFRKLKEGRQSDRKELDEMRMLADTIPRSVF